MRYYQITLAGCIICGKNIWERRWSYLQDDHDSRCTLKSPENLISLFNHIIDISSDQKWNSDDIRNCKFYNTDEIQSINKLHDNHSLSLFYFNSCSLSKNIEHFQRILGSAQIDFDVTAITETRTIKNKFPANDINLKNYGYEYCLTEWSAEGTLFYKGNHLSHKQRNDLCVYKTAELESTLLSK